MRDFIQLKSSYESGLREMKITRTADVDAAAAKLVRYATQDRYAEASTKTGVPQIWMATSFEREASSDFTRSPAQGDPLDRVSTHVPRGRGPFKTATNTWPQAWTDAAIDAYHLDRLDAVGAANWTWPLACFYAELFNGFGYRSHGVRSPYLWGGTNLQQPGKYVRDGVFDSTVMDAQIGVVPVMMRMAEMAPGLALPGDWPFGDPRIVGPLPGPAPTPFALTVDEIKAVQRALLAKGFDPAGVDGSFGRKTSAALRAYEAANGLVADGLLDQTTVDKLLSGG